MRHLDDELSGHQDHQGEACRGAASPSSRDNGHIRPARCRQRTPPEETTMMTTGPTQPQPPHADSPLVPFTDDVPIVFGFEDLQFLFTVTLNSLKAWNEDGYPDYLDHEQARRRLSARARPLTILNEAQLRQTAPQTAAQRTARHDGTHAR